MSISENNRINVKDKALTGQRVIKITRNGEDVFLPVGLSALDPNGGSGDSTVKYGYWTADGMFQEVDLSVDPPVAKGDPITVDAVMFDTGKESPDYGGSGVDPSVITTTADQVLDSAKYMTSDGVLADGAIQTLSSGQYEHTPTASDITIQTKGKYCSDNIVIKGDSALVSGNIKKDVEIFGVKGTLEGGESADLTNLTAGNIKYGVTINGVQGTFSEELLYPAEPSLILHPFRAFVNGQYVEGQMEDLGSSAPYIGYWPQATDLVIPSAGKYCSSDIVVSGDANFKAENIKDEVTIWGVKGTYKGESSGGGSGPGISLSGAGFTAADGEYYLQDSSATGGDRVLVNKDNSNAKIYYTNSAWFVDVDDTHHYYAEGIGADASLEDIVSAGLLGMYAADEPAPTLKVITSTSEGGSAKPTPGATNVIIGIGTPGQDNNWFDVKAYSPHELSATEYARTWIRAGQAVRIEWNGINWEVYDDEMYGKVLFIGDASDDPWDCVWTPIQDNEGDEVICVAVEY